MEKIFWGTYKSLIPISFFEVMLSSPNKDYILSNENFIVKKIFAYRSYYKEIIKPMLEALFKEMQSSKLGPHLPFDLINVLIEYSEKNAVLDQFILSIDQRKLVDYLIKTKVNSDIILSIKETASKVNSDFLNYFSNSITFQQINQPTEKDSMLYFY